MALARRGRDRDWPQPFDPFDRGALGRGLLDWPLDLVAGWQRAVEEDQITVEEFIDEGQLVVRAELPGVDPDKDVDISIVNGNLRIRAERRQEQQVEERNVRRSEIRYGSFSRVLPLPANAKEDDITATYRDGILEVRAPIEQEPAKPSRIEITRG